MERSKKFLSSRTAHRIIRCGLLAAVTVAASGIASAQDTDQDKKDEMTFSLPQNTTIATRLTPEQGNSEFLATRRVGAQGYVCLPSGSGASWTVNNARPEATLFTNVFGAAFQVITHFLSPVQNPNDIGPKPPRFGDVTCSPQSSTPEVRPTTSVGCAGRQAHHQRIGDIETSLL